MIIWQIYPPVGQRVGRGKMASGFQNQIDAKKPDSRKNPFYRNTNTKPNEVGLCWRGEARERADGAFCIKKSPEQSGLCFDDGAAGQIRTGDLILTKDALYLLSYSSKVYAPKFGAYVATEKGLEPSTSGVTGRRSNRLNHSATAWL